MTSAIGRLMSLRAQDVMSPQSVNLAVDQTMEAAAATFARHHITGAPVVDETGKCVGVLSASDFVKRAIAAASVSNGDREKQIPSPSTAASVLDDEIRNDKIRRHMSASVQTIRADAPMITAARAMCNRHIHRLIVLDDQQRPVGMVSSLDIVAALINSLEERPA